MRPTREDAALLMPEWLMREAVVKLDLTSWWVLHELAHTAQVTIWKLVGGLRRLDLIDMRRSGQDDLLERGRVHRPAEPILAKSL